MKLLHKFLFMCIVICCMIVQMPIYAQEDTYQVRDEASGFSEDLSSYREANSRYQELIDEYDNLLLLENGKIIKMEYGIVGFNSDEACSINIAYESVYKNEEDYLNGCYGIDAAYLGSSDDGERVYFMIGGDYGYTSSENVTLRPYESLETGISVYGEMNGHLVHKIMSQLDYDFYSYSLQIGKMPDLPEAKQYFSYDGHFFYDDFYKMIDDYREEKRENALNQEAYYCYFQYLPHRSLSNYTSAEMRDYLSDTLGLSKRLIHYIDLNGDAAADEVDRSQLCNETDEFFAMQYMYGCNALMLAASAINESAYGKSYNSFISNNLYTAAAYENDEERENGRFDSVSDSIYSHAKYFISGRFSNHYRSDYTGTFFGNKISGINVNYSPDPYYGERSAAACFLLDERLGAKDLDSLCIGIIEGLDRLTLYEDQEMEKRMYSLSGFTELAFVILDETEDAYKVQIDDSFDDGYRYDFDRSVAYIAKEHFSHILNEDKTSTYDLKEIHYDFDEGEYHDYESLDLQVIPEEDLLIRPEKDGFEFIGYDEENKAQYKKIVSIDLISGLSQAFEAGKDIDLKDALLKVNYGDSSSSQINVNTDMISAYDKDESGEQTLEINYNGLKTEKTIFFSDELADLRQTISDATEDGDALKVKSSLGKIVYPFNFSEIRSLDIKLRELNQRNYVIDDRSGKFKLSVSGLDLSLPDKMSLKFLGDTYYVIVDEISKNAEEAIYKVGKGHGFEKREGLNISFCFNYQNIELQGPAIVQIDLKDKKNDKIYTVYHLNKNGDVVKCRTTQSDNYIQFMISESGSYLVMSMDSVNEFNIRDSVEDLSYENMGFDNHRVNFELMSVIVLSLIGIIGITVYYIYLGKREKLWRDFRRSLRTADFVQEEKPKS